MRHLLFFLLLPIFLACKKDNSALSESFEELYTPIYSENFKISQDSVSGEILISVFNPWQGSKNVSLDFHISSNDTQVYDNDSYIRGFPERIVCMSSTHIAMLDALGATDKIVGVSGKQYISNQYLRENPDIPDIGYEGNIDYETLVSTRPDLVLLFSVNGPSAMEAKLKELKIPFMYVGDYVEESPLGKTEWLIPLAQIVGKREEGLDLFKEIETQYLQTKDYIASKISDRPEVMVNAPFLDSWFMPSNASYVARMIEDAGGHYIYNNNSGNSSLPIDLEEALQLVSKANYWINTGSIKSLNELKTILPKFGNTRVVKEAKVYNNNLKTTPGGGNDCYESGVVYPHLILRDMAKIFHPNLFSDDFTYYHHLQ